MNLFGDLVFKKSKMDKLVESITGGKKINDTTNIVVCGIAKMFVGELVETARVVMRERKESGPIRPCYIRVLSKTQAPSKSASKISSTTFPLVRVTWRKSEHHVLSQTHKICDQSLCFVLYFA